MSAENGSLIGHGLCRIPRMRDVVIPVEVIDVRKAGTFRVDVLVRPIGGFGEFWTRQSSLIQLEEVNHGEV